MYLRSTCNCKSFNIEIKDICNLNDIIASYIQDEDKNSISMIRIEGDINNIEKIPNEIYWKKDSAGNIVTRRRGIMYFNDYIIEVNSDYNYLESEGLYIYISYKMVL